MSNGAKLTLLGEDGENPPPSLPQSYVLTKERTTIGRSRSADLTMDSEAYPCTLSRVHAIILRKQEDEDEYSWWITDCGSLNGTFINCVKVKDAQLHEGDTLTLGGGAGLNEGERSDALASDLVFRFEPCSAEAANAASPMHAAAPAAIAAPAAVARAVSVEAYAAVAEADADAEAGAAAAAAATSRDDAAVSASTGADDGVAPPTPDRGRTRKRDEDDRMNLSGSSTKRRRSQGTPGGGDTGSDKGLTTSLLDEFKCPICCDYFINATTLACSHSFCELCIGEWLHRKHECAVCRQPVTSKPIRSNALDKSVQLIIESDGYNSKDWLKRKKQHAQREQQQKRALDSLLKRLENAKKKQQPLLNIAEVWDNEQVGTFDMGVNNYRGSARETYCSVTGLTAEWIEEATIPQLQIAAKNVNLVARFGPIPDAKLRKRLHMFIQFC